MKYDYSEKKLLVVAVCILIAYVSPYFILGENTPVSIHDNLDISLVCNTMLVHSGEIFGSIDSTISQVMNGLPRNTLGSEFSVILLLFYLFPPFIAYALNLTFMHFISFVGMYLLLSKHLIPERKDNFIAVGVALCFALLPFWPFGGLSVAGMPLALYAFLNIRSRDSSYKDWVIICVLPFYSSFALSFFFFLTAMGMLWIIDLVRKRDLNLNFIESICLMTGIFLAVEYRLVYGMFLNSGYVSHRVEYFTPETPENGFVGCLKNALLNFGSGQYHAISLHTTWIGLSIFIALILVLLNFLGKREYNSNLVQYSLIYSFILITFRYLLSSPDGSIIVYIIWGLITLMTLFLVFNVLLDPYVKEVYSKINSKTIYVKLTTPEREFYPLIFLIFLCFSISFFYGFWNWNSVYPVKEQITLLRTFNFSRFNFLHPLLWYLIFATSLKTIVRGLKHGKYMAMATILLQVSLLFTLSGNNIIQTGGIGCLNSEQMTFNEFYSPSLFNDIKNYVGEPLDEYRVVCIGLPPAVIQYNGFYTLDAYQVDYPLEYKHKFRELIEKELDKNKDIRDYFDSWGSRCYVFTAEKGIDFVITKDKSTPIKDLEFNTQAFKEMGGKYIFSAEEIQNYEQNNFELVETFENEKSPWKIWVYRAK